MSFNVNHLLLDMVYMACHNLGSPVIDGIFLVQKMCIYSSVMIMTTVLITRSAVQWHGQLVIIDHVYIIEIIKE